MKKNWLLLAMFGLFMMLAQNVTAQTQRRKKHKEKTSSFWKEDVWYGGQIQLGYSGSRNYSTFVAGLTPMLGFKIKDTPFSVGPRVGYTYTSIKGIGSDGKTHRIGLSSFTTAAFGRIKFLQQFFLHVEYGLEWTKQVGIDTRGRLFIQDGKVYTSRLQRDNFFVGAGYNPGGYEMMVLYNFSVPDDSLEQPFSFRGGFTINF